MFNARCAWVALASCLLLGPQIAEGQEGANEAEIVRLVAKYDSSWTSQDTVELSRLLAPEYQYFTSRGGVWSRTDLLRLVGSPSYVLQQAQRSEIEVTRRHPVAVVSSRWQGHGSYRGKPFADDQRCGQVWLRTADEWHLVVEHCTQILGSAPSN